MTKIQDWTYTLAKERRIAQINLDAAKEAGDHVEAARLFTRIKEIEEEVSK